MPPELPRLFVGLGSNLLVRDGGFPGMVICLHGALGALRREEAPGAVYAEAGVGCAQLARFAAAAGLGGAAFFAGIPGTVGGALAMNAGAFGGQTWERVAAVETVDAAGVVHWRRPAEFRIGYRSVEGPPGEAFLGARFVFPPDEDGREGARIKELLALRGARQPIGRASCGSVFRNPPGDHAGRLIEAAGLKGARRGGAVVSDKHANFILNEGGASAAQIEALIEHVRAVVAERFGVRLQTEVVIVGEPG
ncbi:MAG: UDP-N-acetylenolpyruvoylglucosamine reductase [Gammaproteobacteria bacterium]|nr:MAG: UDP-N-acetylenolpyruvoylglucosamine reductase [Gammaproteobacteria bacterium]